MSIAAYKIVIEEDHAKNNERVDKKWLKDNLHSIIGSATSLSNKSNNYYDINLSTKNPLTKLETYDRPEDINSLFSNKPHGYQSLFMNANGDDTLSFTDEASAGPGIFVSAPDGIIRYVEDIGSDVEETVLPPISLKNPVLIQINSQTPDLLQPIHENQKSIKTRVGPSSFEKIIFKSNSQGDDSVIGSQLNNQVNLGKGNDSYIDIRFTPLNYSSTSNEGERLLMDNYYKNLLQINFFRGDLNYSFEENNLTDFDTIPAYQINLNNTTDNDLLNQDSSEDFDKQYINGGDGNLDLAIIDLKRFVKDQQLGSNLDLTKSGEQLITYENLPITGVLNPSDFDDLTDGTYFTISTDGSNGSVIIDEGTGAWSYTPNLYYHGDDQFIITVTDDLGGTIEEVVSISIPDIYSFSTRFRMVFGSSRNTIK